VTTEVVPILRVADVARAVAWYARIGFSKVFEHPFADHLPADVGMERDAAAIHLSEHDGDASGPGLVDVWIDDLDPLAERFGIIPDEMPWARDIEVTDPEGIASAWPSAGRGNLHGVMMQSQRFPYPG